MIAKHKSSERTAKDWTFFYNQPADHWYDSLPLANGRMGVMVYGGVRVERLFLSETTFWSGEPSSANNNRNGPALFRSVREKLLAGDVVAANEQAEDLIGHKLNYGTNLPFGNLRLLFNHIKASPAEYRRELDLATAITHVHYRIDDVEYQREMFVSAPHQVIVVRLTCSHPAMLSFQVALDGDEQPSAVWFEEPDTLLMDNRAWEALHSNNGQVGASGHARVCLQHEGGRVGGFGSHLIVEQTNSVTILVAMGTSFNGNDPASQCQTDIETVADIPYEILRADHVAEHQAWFGRVDLDLGFNSPVNLPLDQRLEAVRQGADDPHLAALLFQFGRYILIGSSRPDSPLPAHLTGAWNDNCACRIGWSCDYHLDINTQMNYWIAELTNLSECHQPLFRWLEQILVPSGRSTAREFYGLPGWVAHIFSNAWGFSAWGWSTWWGIFPTGGVWVATHLWDHYCFTQDRAFLTECAYPILKEAAEFCLAYLVKEPHTGWLISGPANSPENAFYHQGEFLTIDRGPTVDRILIYELFSICVAAGQLLGVDEDFRAALQDALTQLPPYQIGQYGQIQEWLDDYEEAVPGHRHTSHLLGLFPFAQITPITTPELAQAARISMERRINHPDFEEGSWARNNITLFYARLQDGEAAYESLTTLFRKGAGDSLFVGTRLAPANAYEIDYNTGATAAIAEMLLQSHRDCIELLPALPPAWPDGKVRGLRARGGFEVDIRWESHQMVESAIRSLAGGVCRVYLNDKSLIEVICEEKAIPVRHSDSLGFEFDTQTGKEYLIRKQGVAA